jgi:hypothetical protein
MLVLFSFSGVFAYTPTDSDKKTIEIFKKSLIKITTITDTEKISEKINRSKNLVKKDSS